MDRANAAESANAAELATQRRSFLTRSAGLAWAVPLWAAGRTATGQAASQPAHPEWMRTLGEPDLAYGAPAAHEAGVVRAAQAAAPETAGFSVWRTPIQALRGTITPSGLHFAVHHNGIPRIDPERHALVIHGAVDRALRFDVERLLRYPMVSRIQFIECSGNTAANAMSPLAMDADAQALFGELSCSEWTGVPLATLLREAGLKPHAAWAIAEGADGGSHQRSLPLAKLMDDALIALYQNGERLRPSQGYPMRLLVPGWEGNVNVKWLHRLEITDRPAFTKDESGLYSEVLADGRIERFTFAMGVKSLITHPSGQQRLPEPGAVYELSGLAWSGHGRIARVEISTDAGRSWAEAALHAPVLSKALTRFSLLWRWNGQATTLLSRATDELGHTQPTRTAWKQRYAAHAFNHYNAVQAWRVHRDGRIENVYA